MSEDGLIAFSAFGLSRTSDLVWFERSGRKVDQVLDAGPGAIRDSGLLRGLLELESSNDILGHPVAGASWERFVIESLINAAGESRRPYFFRTEDGAEIDLVFERGGRVEMAIEIKRTTAPEISKGFRLACESLEPQHTFVVHGGTAQWPLANGVSAISLEGMMRHLEGVPPGPALMRQ